VNFINQKQKKHKERESKEDAIITEESQTPTQERETLIYYSKRKQEV
jgi:hypothetical protein